METLENRAGIPPPLNSPTAVEMAENTDLLFLGGELGSIRKVLHEAAAAALMKVRAWRLHSIAVLAQNLRLVCGGKGLLDCCDACQQPLSWQRSLAEHCVAARQLAHTLQQWHMI